MNFDWLPKDSAKWIGIIIGAGVLVTLLLPKINCAGSPSKADTVYVPVPSLPDTIRPPAIVLKPKPLQDTARIDSFKRVIWGKDSTIAKTNRRADSLFNELLTVREGTVPVRHEDTNYVLVGKIPVDYDPIGRTFGASLIVDSLSVRAPSQPDPDIGIQPVQIVSGGILTFLLLILTGAFK